MKKLIFCLFFVSMVAFPLNATAWEQLDYTVDIKGYGNQVADYSTGCLNVDSNTETWTNGTSYDWTSFNNTAGDPAPCVGPGCGMSIQQGDFTTTEFNTHNTTYLDGKNLVGSADMSSLGGLAACVSYQYGTPLPSYDGSLYQTQTVKNLTYGEICPGVHSSAGYEGTQTLNLKINYAP